MIAVLWIWVRYFDGGSTVILKGLRVLAENGERIVTRRMVTLRKREQTTRARLAALEAKAARLRAVLAAMRRGETPLVDEIVVVEKVGP